MTRRTVTSGIGPRRSAYTLVEVLAVVVIIGLLVAASVPAFNAMAKSSNAALADTQLRLAVSAARDAAIQSLDGRDAAAVFFYDPNGRISVEVHRDVGTVTDSFGRSRSIFARDPAFETVQLPRRQHVVGLAPPASIVSSSDSDPYTWYSAGRYPTDETSWVFPETGFYDPETADEGPYRSTFMVRFEAVTGAISTESGEALVYAPSPEIDFRQGAPFNVASRRPDRNPDHLRLVRTMASDVTMTAAVRERLIGDLATDTVLARPVRTIALYHVSDMVKAIRASGATVLRGVDTVTGCLYTGWRRNDTPRPDFAWASELANAISEEDAAELYFVDRYTGSLSHLARTND
ncbi:MAG: type II secretion system protein [Phycisphaerales bacterium]|nr:type II secretion system protein [Phycisphaerales bacterium]